MLGPSHRVLAAVSWMTIATQLGAPTWQVVAGAAPAAVFSAGLLSPDIDNTPMWKRLDRWVPDEWLGDGGPLGHRELTHWWGLPAIVAASLQTMPAPWWVWAAIVGWVSHIAGDLIFGKRGYGTPRGIPLAPWWWHVGVGLKCGGLGERTLVPVLGLAAVWLAVGAPTDVGTIVEAVG